MTTINFDALEKQASRIEYVTLDRDSLIAILALARRTEEAERECAAERNEAERERGNLATQAQQVQSRMLVDLRERIAERDSAVVRAESAERERNALRAALIHVADLQLRRHEDAAHVRAIRSTANDLRAPFSDERVTARLVEMRAGDPRDAALDAAAARIAEVMRERDEARAALAEACEIGRFFAGDGDEPDTIEVVRAHALRIAELRKIAAGAPARPPTAADRADVEGGGLPVPSAKPLDPAHAEVLRGMAESSLEAKRMELEGLRERYSKTTRQTEAALEREIAALEALLGEEAKP